MDCDETTETSTEILIPHMYKKCINLVFQQEEWLVGDDPLYLKFGPNLPCSCKNANFRSIFTGSASAVTPSKK